MSAPSFMILQCSAPECRFRFPKVDDNTDDKECPRCGAPTKIEVANFANQLIRISDRWESAIPMHGLLDNIRSSYNVGSIFRTANGAGLSHLHLCGITPTPDNPRVGKTSLGAELSVAWSHHNNSIDLAGELRTQGFYLVAFESGTRHQWTSGTLFRTQPSQVAIIVGNELSGVDPGLIDICDDVWSIPMIGEKTSLNVTVAFGIAAYYLQFYSRFR